MRISDWSSDVCSSDLVEHQRPNIFVASHAEAQQITRRRQCDGIGCGFGAPAHIIRAHCLSPCPHCQIEATSQNHLGHRPALIPKSDKSYAHPCSIIIGSAAPFHRSEERRVGKECVSTVRSRWSPDHEKKKKHK